MYIVVGLGNPGSKYELTKHNVGFMTIDYLAKELDIKMDTLKFKSLIGQGMYKGEKIILVKPQTYMNLSGEAVVQLVNFYKVPMENLYVIYDDVDLPLGKLRIRQKGSSGTHNGMRNIIYLLGKDDFPRFRLGILKDRNQMDLASYVLSRFTKEELKVVEEACKKCSDAILCAIENTLDISMNRYNKN